MKKLISLALAIVMIMCLSITAFAETVEAPGTCSAAVTGSYVAGNESGGIVYCVDITWSDLDFTYHAEKGAVWDPESLTYSEEAAAYWEGQGTINISNRSNTDIFVSPEYTPAEGYDSADMIFSGGRQEIASAESGTAGTGTITVTPNGSLPAMDAAATIGTITLTVGQYTDDLDLIWEAEDYIAEAEALTSQWIAAGGSESDADYFMLAQLATEDMPAAIAAFRANPNDPQSKTQVENKCMLMASHIANLDAKLKEL